MGECLAANPHAFEACKQVISGGTSEILCFGSLRIWNGRDDQVGQAMSAALTSIRQEPQAYLDHRNLK